MQVHPDIAALRSDPLLQRRVLDRMTAAADEWKGEAFVDQVVADLQRFSQGTNVEDCAILSSLMTDQQAAMKLVRPWLTSTLDALRTEPLGEVPHRYRCSGGVSSLQLLEIGGASLRLIAFERRPRLEHLTPETVLFSDVEAHEIVLAGGATGTFHRLHEERLGASRVETWQMVWRAGSIISISGAKEKQAQARQVARVDGAMVLLQLSRLPQKAMASREYRLSDGALLQSASGDKGASQRFMALAVLGAMQHEPATEKMVACALNSGEDHDVRWEALRQVLAMDSEAGWTLLRQISVASEDPLRHCAQRLSAQLASVHPQLLQQDAA